VPSLGKRTGLAAHARVELDRFVQQHRDPHRVGNLITTLASSGPLASGGRWGLMRA
jgi:hypothetical protein